MLDANSLSCRRGARLVFRDVGFRLAPGALLQVTGPNGSGKSSLLRTLAGLLPLAGGELFWQGQPAAKDAEAHRARLHYIGHLDALKPELTANEMLAYWRALRPVAEPNFSDPFGMGDFGNKPIRFLSAGQKRRLTLSRLALDDAPLWLLDEPATSLDAEGQSLLSRHIAGHRAKGGIVIAALHHALDAEGAQILAMAEPKR
jgi:heme exporter protein A